MKRMRLLHDRTSESHVPLAFALLFVCFLFGILVGTLIAGSTSERTDSELYRYLVSFFQAAPAASRSATSLFRVLLLYIRYPVLAFLFGFSAIGIAGLPLLSFVFGFFLGFSVGNFASVLGFHGICLALAAMGLRCLITFLCYFWIAVPAFSSALSKIRPGSKKRAGPNRGGRAYFFCAASSIPILVIGIILELYLVPSLVSSVYMRIFT